jgi:hypothetical protein
VLQLGTSYIPLSFTRSAKNKGYALKALSFLRQNPGLAHDEKKLWGKVMDGAQRQENSQMDFVTILWQNALIDHGEV